ncbi:MAG: phosphoenolpyruvate carboxykinase (GTP) [Acholeplasmataceae bacterium]|nr:phosphoenolpyruvate carboxykinase (GTP) [Acholeplasmataceae bacterium]
MISYHDLNQWVKKMAELCNPTDIHWIDGSEEENERFLEQLVFEKKAMLLNPQKRPNSYAFFSDPSDVARVEDRTFIASQKKEDAGPTNNWMDPKELKKTMLELYKGSMKGRTMYVIPYMMGPYGSPLSKIGIEITDSLYVVINMRIMTRVGRDVLKKLEELGSFIPCLHSVGYPLGEGVEDLPWPSAPIDHKFISHFPEEKQIWSYGSGYGGNALLGKKCLALRIASVIAREEMWMAEHMLILKLTNPEGVSKYILGAFPSACGKTNLSMLVPTLPGWKVETIGDDIAWIWMKDDGRLYAINPEAGFFGVARGTSFRTNPNAMMAIRKNTIFTNVAITDDQDVWWEDIDGPIPDHLIDWKKEDWTPSKGTLAAHPNCRFTVAAKQSPVIAQEWEDPQGVLISAILVGGRRPSTIPLIHEAFSWSHGVFMGSMMGSEITAASISNDYGKVRRDPFAMLPFIGYHLGDYLKHWLDMGKRSNDALLPKIYYVNWFRKDDSGAYLWPGFGHNSRILKWIFERCDGVAQASITPIGNVPTMDSIDIRGLPMKSEALSELLYIDTKKWLEEVESIQAYYDTIGDKLPEKLSQELKKLEQRLLYEKNKEEENLNA